MMKKRGRPALEASEKRVKITAYIDPELFKILSRGEGSVGRKIEKLIKDAYGRKAHDNNLR